jgi:hypothetical protein
MPATTKNRIRRATLIAAAAVFGLGFVLALPAFQVRIARAFIGDLEGVTLELGYLWAGPNGVDVRGLRVEAGSLEVSVAAANVDLAFWASLASGKLDIEAVQLRDVDVLLDRSTLPPEELAAERQAFAGLKPLAKIPPWLALRELAAEGDVALRTARGDIDAAGPWQLNASALAAESTASARLTATLDTRRSGEVLAASRVDASATARIDADSQILDLALGTDVRPADDDERGLRAAAALAFDAAGEHYTFDLDGRVAGRLVHAEGVLTPDGNLEGSWEANVTPGVVAAFARGRSLADLSGTSTGQIAFDRANRRMAIRAMAQGEGRGWEAFDPRLAGLGALALDLAVDAALEPGVVDAESIALSLSSATRGEMLRIATLQPLRYETGNWLVDPETWGEPALRIQATALPLQWLRPFSPAANLEGGELTGAVDFIRDEERRTRIVVTEPLRAVGVELQPVEGVAFPAFDLAIVPHATLENGALEAEIEELTLTSALGTQLQFQGRGKTSRTDWPIADFEGTVSGRLPLLQRIVPQLDQVRGTTRMRFDFRNMLLTIDAVAVGAESSDGRELLAADLSSQEPLTLRVPNFAADWDAFSPQTLTLKLDRMPIDWLSPYMPELQFRGGEASGQFRLAGGGGQGIRLEVDEPIVIANALPVFRGMEARQTITATVRPRLLLSNALSSFALEDLRIDAPDGGRLTGEIRVEAPAAAERIAISVALDGEFRRFAERYGARFNTLRFRQRSELEPASGRFAVQELALNVVAPTGADILELETLRPFFITTEPFGVGVDSGSPEILRVVVTPLRLEDLMPQILGFDVEGLLPEGEFYGRAIDGRLVLAADAPLMFRNVSVRWGGATLLDRVTMGVQYEVAYSAGGLEARSVDLTATAPDGRMLMHVASKAVAPLTTTRLLDSARMSIEANLAPLSDQPVFAELPPFTAGTLATSLDFVNGEEATLALSVGLAGAVAEGSGALPDLDVSFDASGVLGDHVRFTLPVHLESAELGPSDLRLEGTSMFDANGVRNFAATLVGEQIVMSDVDRLSAIFAPTEEESAVAQPPPGEAAAEEQSGLAPLSEETRSAIAKLRAERDSVPAWTDRLRGTATVDVKRIVYPTSAIEGLRGKLEVTPERAAVTDLEASLFGAAVTADVIVGFAAEEPKPYTLDFHAAIDDLDLGRVFRAVAPEVTPTTEGTFDFSTSLRGTGLNPLDLGLSSLGEIRLEGRDGIFRGLADYEGTGSTASRVIGFLTFSKELRAIARILDRIGELHFERAEFVLERTAANRLELSNLLVLAPQLRVQASGNLERTGPQTPVVLSPLDISARLAARSDVAILFDGMKLLEAVPDAAGYRALVRPIAIRGTPAEPDAEEFWALLEEGAENAGGSFGVALRALNRQLEAAEPVQ